MSELAMHPELAALKSAGKFTRNLSGLPMVLVGKHWRVFGAIPRKPGPARFPAAAFLERIKQPVLNLDQRAKYAGFCSLRFHVHHILDQGSVGSCATEDTAQLLMMQASRQGQPVELLNPWTLYRQVTNTDSGSDTLEDVEYAAKVGICPMAFWDREVHTSWKSAPPTGWEKIAGNYQIAEYAECSTYDEHATFAALGYPVGVSNSSFWGGGHSTTGAEYNADGSISGPNSWGEDWGASGWYTMPMSHWKRGFQEGYSQVVVLSVKYSGKWKV